MKTFLLLCCALTVVVAQLPQQQRQVHPQSQQLPQQHPQQHTQQQPQQQPQQQQYYSQKYDNFNPDVIIQNDRILLAYYKCVMDKGPCSKEGKNFKKVLPETLSSACGRCNPAQKMILRKILLGIRSKSETKFEELLDKYNPDRANRDALYNFLVTGN